MGTVVIQPPAHDPLAAFGIAAIAVVVAALWILLLGRGDRPRGVTVLVVTVAVMAGSALAARSGLLARFDLRPPPMLLMVLGVVALGLGTGLSPLGRRAAAALPLAALVGLQAFRLPLELVMHHAATRGIMPVQMSYSGYNFDVATGLGALVLGAALAAGARVPRPLLWLWNVWGIWCLVAVLAVALAASPMVRAFGDAPADLNTWVLFFPYVWLPVVLVTVAIASHAMITRKLVAGAGGAGASPSR